MPYTFSNTVLSAAKSMTPGQAASLSANGINIISLSTNDVGLSYNANTTLSNVLSTLTVDGSVFRIDTSYSGQKFSLNKLQINNLSQYTVFTYLSSLATTPVSAYDQTTQVSTPNHRRLRLLGYR
jgi:hypothetical protein